MQELPLSEFSPSKENRDGRTSYCRSCFRVRDAGYRAARAAAQGKIVRPRPVLPDGRARCPSCKTVKPIDECGTRSGGRTGRVSYCYPCFNRIKEESRQRVHGGSRNYHLQRRYGITAADADAMAEAQGGLCAICRERPAEHVDHDHLTGKVRGMPHCCATRGSATSGTEQTCSARPSATWRPTAGRSGGSSQVSTS